MNMKREWDSTAYDRLSDPQYGWGLKVLEKLKVLPLRGNEHILDAGCGTGRVTEKLLQAFPQSQVTAVDASANMVDEAGKRLAPFGQRVKIAQVDLLELPDQNSFDVIFSTAVFHWIQDHDRLFQIVFRALRPGGFLLAQCGGGPNLARIHGRAELLMQLPECAPYFKDWKRFWEYPCAQVTADRLQRAGFVDVATGLEAAPTPLPDEATFRSFTAAVNMHPYLKRLPPELHDSFIGALAELARQDDPPFELDYWRLNIFGRKA
jgi:trans-aconitate 2-methyltransferase